MCRTYLNETATLHWCFLLSSHLGETLMAIGQFYVLIFHICIQYQFNRYSIGIQYSGATVAFLGPTHRFLCPHGVYVGDSWVYPLLMAHLQTTINLIYPMIIHTGYGFLCYIFYLNYGKVNLL